MEIIDASDKTKYTQTEITENIEQLVNRWGSWTITAVGGISVEYVNIKNAVFNGLSTTTLILAVISVVLAIVLGKILFPYLSNLYLESNASLNEQLNAENNELLKKQVKMEDRF